MQLAAPAGGTDPLGALVTGNPISPIWAGEIQCRGLGLAIEVLDEAGHSLVDTPGELVVTKPFPSMPVALWDDPSGERYLGTYFKTFPGVWRQGDWAVLNQRGGVVVFGRSDATLKVRGIRIGTSEIYRALRSHVEIVESVAVAWHSASGEAVILFVKLIDGLRLDDRLAAAIRASLRENLSPRHEPDYVFQVPDIPRTVTGKISESAVRAAINGEPVANVGALANPDSLKQFVTIRQERLST